MLGKDITAFFSAMKEYNVFVIYRNPNNKLPFNNINIINSDVTDPVAFSKYLKEIKPEIIIHCAAIVNVEACESERDYADKLHCEIIKQIAESSPSSKLIYISSDSVFDGTRGNYQEFDIPNPINYYAKSKYDGEVNTLRLVKNSIVVRTNIYGFHFQKQSSLAEWALDNLQQSKTINGFNDVYFNPVYTKQLADILYKLIAINYKGIINISSNTFITKYSFLVEIAKTFGYDTNLIEAKSVNSVNFKARRPNNTTLNTDLLKDVIGIVPDLFEGIKYFHTDYKNLNNKILVS